MERPQKFEDLQVWGKSRELVRLLYEHSEKGTFRRDFGLRDQIRRAGVSVAANIAEGHERDGNRELIQFLSQAKGSCGEVRSHLWIAFDQQYLEDQVHRDLMTRCLEIGRMLAGLIDYLKRSDLRGTKYR